MLAASLISFHEGLEAALIVGILIGYLVKIGQRGQVGVAWAGVAAAVFASALVALGIRAVDDGLRGGARQVFDGTIMFLAVGVLTWMIFWMRSQARFLKGSLEREVQTAVTSGQAPALFGLAFALIFREGVETALFLSASAFVAQGGGTPVGAVLGLGLAAVMGWFIYASTARLNPRAFFNVTSVLLLLFAAGLFAHGVHEFQDADVLPQTIEHVWDTHRILDEESALGETMKTLFGYNSEPSLLEVISYLAYWVVALVGVRGWVERRSARLTASQAKA